MEGEALWNRLLSAKYGMWQPGGDKEVEGNWFKKESLWWRDLGKIEGVGPWK